MTFLTQLEIRRVRNISHTKIQPANGLNLIYGENASGKTSLLEAIHILSLGRSFRTPKISNLIQNETMNLQVVGHVNQSDASKTDILGIERGIGQSSIRINTIPTKKTSDLAGHLPVQVITPEAHHLLEQGPSQRRKFLDWGLFHVEHNFLSLWQQYHRVLKQRNAAIRKKSPVKEIQLWDEPLIDCGKKLTTARNTYLTQIIPLIQKTAADLLALDVSLDYYPGWGSKFNNMEEAMAQNINSDVRQGYTHVGPHRAELNIYAGNNLAKDVFSRGQQKLLVCALKLAQIEHLKQIKGHSCIVMVDDLAAELDETKRKVLLDHILRSSAQTFVTTTEISLIDSSNWETKKMFHVEHGSINEVV